MSSVAGRDGDLPLREDPSRTGTGGGEEASLGAGEEICEEEGGGEGCRTGDRKQGEDSRRPQ